MTIAATGQVTRSRRRRVIEYDDVVDKGCAQFLRDGTIDLEHLAADAAVSRATLFRVIPGRDRLLGDVLWRLGEPMLRPALDGAGRGVEGLLAGTRSFFETLMGQRVFRRFLAVEPDTAIRVLLTPAGGVHEHVVDAQRRAFATAMAEGTLPSDVDLDALAELYVRIYESMLYADLLSERPADLDLAERAARAVLRDVLVAGDRPASA